MSYYSYTSLAVFFLSFLALAITYAMRVVAKFFSTFIFKISGAISYGIYLIYEPANYALQAFFFHSLPSFATTDTVLGTLLAPVW
jgi:peptidoglycan/LPS O-acetylase OafA/YrhL